MYSSGAVNFPISIPPPNYCAPAPLVQGNIPFQQFAPPFYPPAAPAYNYYQNTAPYNGSNPGGNNPPFISNYNSTTQMPLFSQPPPGYSPNGNHMGPSPIHMANVCSPSFNGFRAPNQFTRPPPAIPMRNDVQKNTPNRFTNNYGNNRRVFDAKNSPYFCEACDKGFGSMAKFTQHKAEHVTCGQEGCTFSAHSKIVEKHFQMQHRSGLFKRIVKGNTPEEIQKWINERKRHFPTKEKIEVKNAQREEMAKRGERYAEQKRKFNERNPNFKPGSNGRYDRNAQHRNNQFKFGRFGQRKNSFRNRNDNRHRPENKRKDLTLNGDEDCFLRNLPPFKGTVYYQNMENNSSIEPEEHIITDDDDISILSGDDDVTIIDYNSAVVNEKVIYEIEKSSETSNVQGDSEKDCLDKYFVNCETVDENGKEPNNCDGADINDSTTETPKLPNDPPVSQSDEVKQSIHDTTVSKSVGSLALIQCYDSDCSENEDNSTEQNDCEVNSSPLSKIVSKSNHLSENCNLVERSSKCIPVEENGTRNDSSSLKKMETKKTNDSSDDSEPDECSSKPVPSEADTRHNSSPVKTVNSEENNHTEPAASSSECAIVTEGDISSSKDDETKGCESKRRKRKRRRDSKGGIEGEEETDKKTEEKLPPLRIRKRYKPPTLLEKLLSSEIKHERNVILQCIRHVVNNNYFNVGESNSS
ncbi:FMR1-interacting protein NUFIP1 [Planococcus citri]|uniref:FMR1-interacting protein NUFIP1 n=1 Tax=Planococcus citri TaxID=170843 RepID=UPI0031F99473